MVRQELASELGVVASLRTVERSVSHLRQELAAAALATVRFETPPGRQLQIDFGQRRIAVEGCERGKVYLFVATLGYSRRVYAQAFQHERQSAWLEGIEGAFRHFGGLPGELLLDNATSLAHCLVCNAPMSLGVASFNMLPIGFHWRGRRWGGSAWQRGTNWLLDWQAATR